MNRTWFQKKGSRMKLFHPSVEGAQHGAKGLDGFLAFAKRSGAVGCQPSNFMLEAGQGNSLFLPADVIKQKLADAGLLLDGVSAHCPFWVHGTAWTGSPTIKPFLPDAVAQKPVGDIEKWAEDYIHEFLGLCAELGVRVVPMFWGTLWGWEVATGYPWGFWKGPGYDLMAAGDERFLEKTEKIRRWASEKDIVLAHEIHPGTGAMCARDFLHIVEICNDDLCLGVNRDDSHCWEGESWEARFDLVGDYVFGYHLKNHHVRPGQALRSMVPDWPNRPMQFTALDNGDINLVRAVEHAIRTGYPQRYCDLTGAKTAPLVVEAEGAFQDLDQVSANSIAWVRNYCCFDVAAGSFEEGMGADK